MVGCNRGRYGGMSLFRFDLMLPPYAAQRYFPEGMVPEAYLTECDSLTEMAAAMLQSMRQFLQHKFHF